MFLVYVVVAEGLLEVAVLPLLPLVVVLLVLPAVDELVVLVPLLPVVVVDLLGLAVDELLDEDDELDFPADDDDELELLFAPALLPFNY